MTKLLNLKNDIRNSGYGNNLEDYLNAKLSTQGDVYNKAIRAITQADLICPNEPTCGGIIDTTWQCATGIESLVDIISNDCCPVKVGLYKGQDVAVDLPASGIFADTTPTIQGECITLTPTYIYQSIEIDDRICNSCGDLTQYLINRGSRAMLNGIRQKMMTAISANAATAITSTGDLLDQLWDVYNAVADNEINAGKRTVILANKSVLNRLMQLRDDDGRPLFKSEDRCPLTGCVRICYAGLEIFEMDQTILPNSAGATTVYAVNVDNVRATVSNVRMETKDWTTTLTDMNNKVVMLACVSAVIPATFAGSVAKTIVTL
jgi:hypothetical protein